MKKIFTLAAMLLIVAAASAQNVEKLFDKYQEDERFQYIYQKNSNRSGSLNSLGDLDNDLTLPNKRLNLKSAGKKMLMLNSKDESLTDQFTKEALNAIKSDKYENTSVMRIGKNRTEKYSLETSKGLEEITFNHSPGNIMLIWYSFLLEK